jgi:hypothetical protein
MPAPRSRTQIVLTQREGKWFLGPAGTSGLLFDSREKALEAATAWLSGGWRREVLVEQPDGTLEPLHNHRWGPGP